MAKKIKQKQNVELVGLARMPTGSELLVTIDQRTNLLKVHTYLRGLRDYIVEQSKKGTSFLYDFKISQDYKNIGELPFFVAALSGKPQPISHAKESKDGVEYRPLDQQRESVLRKMIVSRAY